jgi:hypothetical protein
VTFLLGSNTKYFEPYVVIERIGKVSCRLQLSPQARINNVVHVVFLKKFDGVPPMSTPPFSAIVSGRASPFLNGWCMPGQLFIMGHLGLVAGAISSRGDRGTIGAIQRSVS